MWNKDERAGKLRQVKGRVKSAIGALIDDREMTADGNRDQVVGDAEETIGQVRKTAGAAVDKIKAAVK